MTQELQWIRNGDTSEPVESSTTSLSILPLTVSNVQLSDAGEYSCQAVLSDGSIAGPVSAGVLHVVGEN